MKKKLLFFAMIGAAVAGIVGCQSAKNQVNSEPEKQADVEETEDEAQEAKGSEEEADSQAEEAREPGEDSAEDTSSTTAKQDEDGTGSKNGEEVVEEVETVEDSMETFVTYYGCPNSKRVARLNIAKNHLSL